MDPSTLPVWAQGAATIAIAIVASIVGVFRYLKTQTKTPAEEGSSVVSASFIDSKVLKDLVESIREHQEESTRDAKKALRAAQDLKEAVQENTEALIVQTDTTANLIRFMNRNTTRGERVNDVTHN